MIVVLHSLKTASAQPWNVILENSPRPTKVLLQIPEILNRPTTDQWPRKALSSCWPNIILFFKLGLKGVTIPLPATFKCPKITSIEKWLYTFAIFSSVLVSVYLSCAAVLIAYQQFNQGRSEEISWNGMVCL